MDEKIKLYESLLNQKANLEKDCFKYSLEYSREFGKQIEELFELKVEAITLKKKIAYCVKKEYRNEIIYSNELDKYIDEEIIEYRKRLNELIEYNKANKENKGIPITYEEAKKIRNIYYKIAHLIHPDLHPEYLDNEEISSLWDEAVIAYKCNKYNKICEIYDKIILKVNDNNIIIEDLDNKINFINEEIINIKENEPYTYKFILDDELEIKEFHNELDKEIKDYKEYKDNLINELSNFNIIRLGDA